MPSVKDFSLYFGLFLKLVLSCSLLGFSFGISFVILFSSVVVVWECSSFLGMLYIDLRPGQTCHSKVMHRKEVTHSNGQ